MRLPNAYNNNQNSYDNNNKTNNYSNYNAKNENKENVTCVNRSNNNSYPHHTPSNYNTKPSYYDNRDNKNKDRHDHDYYRFRKISPTSAKVYSENCKESSTTRDYSYSRIDRRPIQNQQQSYSSVKRLQTSTNAPINSSSVKQESVEKLVSKVKLTTENSITVEDLCQITKPVTTLTSSKSDDLKSNETACKNFQADIDAMIELVRKECSFDKLSKEKQDLLTKDLSGEFIKNFSTQFAVEFCSHFYQNFSKSFFNYLGNYNEATGAKLPSLPSSNEKK